MDEYAQRVDLDARADLVGITCGTPNASHVYRLADAFRPRGRIVVLGGPHPTLLPEEARPHADALVIGEAETTWPGLLEDAARGSLERECRAAEPVSLERDRRANRGRNGAGPCSRAHPRLGGPIGRATVAER